MIIATPTRVATPVPGPAQWRIFKFPLHSHPKHINNHQQSSHLQTKRLQTQNQPDAPLETQNEKRETRNEKRKNPRRNKLVKSCLPSPNSSLAAPSASAGTSFVIGGDATGSTSAR